MPISAKEIIAGIDDTNPSKLKWRYVDTLLRGLEEFVAKFNDQPAQEAINAERENWKKIITNDYEDESELISEIEKMAENLNGMRDDLVLVLVDESNRSKFKEDVEFLYEITEENINKELVEREISRLQQEMEDDTHANIAAEIEPRKPKPLPKRPTQKQESVLAEPTKPTFPFLFELEILKTNVSRLKKELRNYNKMDFQEAEKFKKLYDFVVKQQHILAVEKQGYVDALKTDTEKEQASSQYQAIMNSADVVLKRAGSVIEINNLILKYHSLEALKSKDPSIANFQNLNKTYTAIKVKYNEINLEFPSIRKRSIQSLKEKRLKGGAIINRIKHFPGMNLLRKKIKSIDKLQRKNVEEQYKIEIRKQVESIKYQVNIIKGSSYAADIKFVMIDPNINTLENILTQPGAARKDIVETVNSDIQKEFAEINKQYAEKIDDYRKSLMERFTPLIEKYENMFQYKKEFKQVDVLNEHLSKLDKLNPVNEGSFNNLHAMDQAIKKIESDLLSAQNFLNKQVLESVMKKELGHISESSNMRGLYVNRDQLERALKSLNAMNSMSPQEMEKKLMAIKENITPVIIEVATKRLQQFIEGVKNKNEDINQFLLMHGDAGLKEDYKQFIDKNDQFASLLALYQEAKKSAEPLLSSQDNVVARALLDLPKAPSVLRSSQHITFFSNTHSEDPIKQDQKETETEKPKRTT